MSDLRSQHVDDDELLPALHLLLARAHQEMAGERRLTERESALLVDLDAWYRSQPYSAPPSDLAELRRTVLASEAEIGRLRADRDRLAAQVQRVRNLHAPMTDSDGQEVCAAPTCGRPGSGDDVPHPCPTVRELDRGEQS